MGNLTVSSKLKNKKSKSLGLWLKLLLCQFVVMLALIPNTFAIFMDNVWIDGKQTSINWCFNSDKLIRAMVMARVVPRPRWGGRVNKTLPIPLR